MKTKTISNFGIIFAVALTMVTTAMLTACNSEDDFGGDLNSDITEQYSLATRMMTRAGEIPPITPPSEPNGKLVKSFTETITFYPIPITEMEEDLIPNNPNFIEPNANASAIINYSIYKSEEGRYSCSVTSYSNTIPGGFTVTGATVVSVSELTDTWDIKFSGMDIYCWPYTNIKYWE